MRAKVNLLTLQLHFFDDLGSAQYAERIFCGSCLQLSFATGAKLWPFGQVCDILYLEPSSDLLLPGCVG
eukprot:COSAG02_NODE_9527_length_2189_cov_1.386603_1_plen_69_part_00